MLGPLEIPEEGDDLDRLIEAYFVDRRILAAENALRRSDHTSVPPGRSLGTTAGYLTGL
jgi:hypothetical protein